MSDSFEAAVKALTNREAGRRRMPLAEAAALLGCHVETLRLRIRQGNLAATRGPNGRYLVAAADLFKLRRPRHLRRNFTPDQVAGFWRLLDRVAAIEGELEDWERELILEVRANPTADIHLHHELAVYTFTLAGLNVEETAEVAGISTRQVRRLRSRSLIKALAAADARLERQDRGKVRREAKILLRGLQARLAARGFQAARRDPRSSLAGSRMGIPARVALVRKLDHRQTVHLRTNGITDEEIHAITLFGIGADELNELILHGLPAASPTSTQPVPMP
jgi:DNA-binding transcriptional MerR regulator